MVSFLCPRSNTHTTTTEPPSPPPPQPNRQPRSAVNTCSQNILPTFLFASAVYVSCSKWDYLRCSATWLSRELLVKAGVSIVIIGLASVYAGRCFKKTSVDEPQSVNTTPESPPPPATTESSKPLLQPVVDSSMSSSSSLPFEEAVAAVPESTATDTRSAPPKLTVDDARQLFDAGYRKYLQVILSVMDTSPVRSLEGRHPVGRISKEVFHAALSFELTHRKNALITAIGDLQKAIVECGVEKEIDVKAIVRGQPLICDSVKSQEAQGTTENKTSSPVQQRTRHVHLEQHWRSSWSVDGEAAPQPPTATEQAKIILNNGYIDFFNKLSDVYYFQADEVRDTKETGCNQKANKLEREAKHAHQFYTSRMSPPSKEGFENRHREAALKSAREHLAKHIKDIEGGHTVDIEALVAQQPLYRRIA